ncbi:MAG: class I SAM-dependent methyltransferase [Hyphomicrobiaceae bacterium]
MHDDGLTTPVPAARVRFGTDYLGRLLDKVLLRTLDDALKRYGTGCLRLALPSGEIAVLGRSGGTREAYVKLNRYRAIWRLMRGGSLGFPESYMDGDIDVSNLNAVFDFYLENEPAMTAAIPAFEATRIRDRVFHSSRRNTRDGSRRNIAAHYDLGNDFYRLWLDPSMLYSSAIFARDDATLEVAQQEKLDRILAALDLAPYQTLLEIGCGWGALAEAAARRGANVTAITISQHQLEAARHRIDAANLTPHVDVRYEDYRDTTGTFDRLVSVEMIEAVGEENWPVYFETIAKRLRPGGTAVIQAITIRADAFDRYRQNPDFIQRYIFPGGMLPTVELMHQRADTAGLRFEIVECFGQSYARTLREWRHRFEQAWPRIEALGFDERFRRMWLYYLAYCEVGFQRGMIDVGLYRLHKPA